MAIAWVQEFGVGDDHSTPNYDAVAERLGAHDNPPEGLIVHTAGFAGDVFRIFDVWESDADRLRFLEERLHPVLAEVMSGREGGPPEPPREYTYELHDVVAP